MFTLLLIVAASGPLDTDMLAQFKSGKMLCTNPDAQSKTCSTIDQLVIGPDGSMTNTGETLIAPDKPMTMEVKSAAHFEDGAMCGQISLADLDKAIVRVDGNPLPADRNAAAVERLKQALGPLADRKTCEGLSVSNGQLEKFGRVDGIDIPLPPKRVRWIERIDGYRVAPRPQ